MNPPHVWALTAAEIAFGGWIASVGYEVIGGVIMGLSAGAFLTRARMEDHVRKFIHDAVTKSESK